MFSVTYEIFTPESIENGESAENGFVCRNVSLREAVDAVGNYALEPSCSTIESARWFANHEYGNGTRAYFRDGISERRSLHVPEHVTDASRRRIARLLGCRVPARR